MTKNIEQENIALKNRIAELEAQKKDSQVPGMFGRIESPEHRYSEEVRNLKKLSQKNKPDTIYYKEIDDHKNVALWHTNGLRVGKLVGPLHPDNALHALDEFYKMGIVLSVKRPTEAEIEEYKNKEEYKKLKGVFDDERMRRLKSKKQSEIDKLTKAIAAMLGVDESQVNDIQGPEGMIKSKAKLGLKLKAKVKK